MKKDFLDKLLSLPQIKGPKVSPNGRFIAYTWQGVGSTPEVFLVPIDGATPPRRMTKSQEATFLVSISADSQSLIVKQDKEGNEKFRLFQVNINQPKKMIPLTEQNPPYFIKGGVLHPNNKYLVYAANYNFKQREKQEAFWIYRHNLKTNQKQILAKPKRPTFLKPRLNKDGSHLLYHRQDLDPQGKQYWLVDIKGEQDREILNFGPRARVQAIWLPEGKRIAFITQTRNGQEQDYYSLGIYHLGTKKIKWLADHPRFNLEKISCPLNSHYLVALGYQKSQARCCLINLNNWQEKRLPQVKGSLVPLSPIKGDQQWTGLFFSSNQPEDIVKFNPNKIEPANFQSLTHVWQRASLKKKDFISAENFEWTSEDGLSLHGWLYRSPQPTQKLIIWVHGGPTAQAQDVIKPRFQYLARAGFNILAPNYRGSIGYGVKFEKLIRKNGWGSHEQKDIWRAARALVKKGLAQKDKIGIAGMSFGGYCAWFAATKAPDLFAAAAPICGMTDLVLDYKKTRPDLRPYCEQMIGGSPQEAPRKYYQRSPINFVEQIKSKLLIVQGLRDPNVNPLNAKKMKDKLDKNGIDYQLLTFKDEGHIITKTKNKKILYKKLADFFQETL